MAGSRHSQEDAGVKRQAGTTWGSLNAGAAGGSNSTRTTSGSNSNSRATGSAPTAHIGSPTRLPHVSWRRAGKPQWSPPPPASAYPALTGSNAAAQSSRCQQPDEHAAHGAHAYLHHHHYSQALVRSPSQQQQQQQRLTSIRKCASASCLAASSISSGQQQQPPGRSVAGAHQPGSCSHRRSISSDSRPHAFNSSSSSLKQQQEQKQAAALALLQEVHPSCDSDLLAEVLQACGGDAAAAFEALEAMMAPAADADAAASSLEQPEQPPAALLDGWRAGPDEHQQQQQQSAGDAYRQLRAEALRLTHQWRNASRKAAAARARGDFGAAQQVAAAAAALKVAADEAHAAAALKVEVANNTDRPDGLWELDLHGLHVPEALAALAARLELVQELVQDLRQQPQQPSAAAASLDLPRYNTKQAVLTSLLLADGSEQPAWQQQVTALRQELRVIVGKGMHSAGGEASLPRAVQTWLQAQGYRFILRGGALGVLLKLL